MPPKFQSSFIPKASVMPQSAPVRRLDPVSFVAKSIFALSILAALGVLGYQFYLKYSINAMGQEIETLRQSLSPQLVQELLDLNSRIVSVQDLVQNHKVISPIFAFLESSTPQSVRFTEFDYQPTENGPSITLRGEAQSFAALALESDVIHKNSNLKSPAFSDIRLDEKGNVTFLLTALVNPETISYQQFINKNPVRSAVTPVSTSTPLSKPAGITSTTTATSTTATSTATTTKTRNP